jgi:hypothetical protein
MRKSGIKLHPISANTHENVVSIRSLYNMTMGLKPADRQNSEAVEYNFWFCLRNMN